MYSHEQIAEKLLEMANEGGSDVRKDKPRLWDSVDQNLMFQQGLNLFFYRKFQKYRKQLISEMTNKYMPLKKKHLSDAASDLKIDKLVEQRKALKQQSQEVKNDIDAEQEASPELLQKKEKLDQKEQEVKRQLLKLNALKYNLLNKSNVNEEMDEKWNEISIFGAPLKVNQAQFAQIQYNKQMTKITSQK